MPAEKCKGCGRMTNSTTSNWWDTDDHHPTKCYVAWGEDGKPVKGCGYDKLAERDFDRYFADSILKKKKRK